MKVLVLFVVVCFTGISGSTLNDPRRSRAKSRNDLVCDVGIVGGGISGLYMAYELKNENPESQICIFEKDDTVGGRIRDHRFEEAPNIDVGLGAWRVDKKQLIMLDFLKELGITHKEWSFVEPSLYESRAIASDDSKDIKIAYPSLKAHPVFGNMSSGQMWDYLRRPDIRAQTSKYSTVFTFMSNMLTSEGAYYLADLSGYKGDITEFISPTHYQEFMDMSYSLSDKYFRPHGGMSAIIHKLHEDITEKGVKLFTNEAVLVISKKKSKYRLRTSKRRVVADKLVVAVPPKALRNIKGIVARKIQAAPQFNSIQPIPAFKGGAVYPQPWWENVKVGETTVQAGQKFISQDNCLGISMAHRDYGTNGEGVMHTVYTDGACAERWNEIAQLKTDYIDAEIHKALEAKYELKIPKPIDTEYQFWDSAWHFQKPDTPFSMVNVSSWARRPFIGEDIFVVGEPYEVMRGWCQSAIVSCRNALKEGWGIERNVVHKYAKRSMTLPVEQDSPARA